MACGARIGRLRDDGRVDADLLPSPSASASAWCPGAREVPGPDPVVLANPARNFSIAARGRRSGMGAKERTAASNGWSPGSADHRCSRSRPAVRPVLSAIRLGNRCYQVVTSEIGKYRDVIDGYRDRKSKPPSSFTHATAKNTATRIAPALITMANTQPDQKQHRKTA